MRADQADPDATLERPDDERGRHNRIGYFNVDEDATSSEHGAEEPDVAEQVDRPEE